MTDPSDTAVRVRGVHATAATRLLVDAGYTVVDPSDTLRERFDDVFGDEDEVGGADVRVSSSEDGIGVYVEGDGAPGVAEPLSRPEDAFALDALAPGDALDATVDATAGSGAFVVTSDGREAFLPYSRSEDRIEEGDELRVTVLEGAPPWSDSSPVVAAGERVGDDLVTLVRGASGARVDGGDRQDATQLSRSMETFGVEPPDGWGVVYSREAVDAELAEVAEAFREARDVAEGSADAPTPEALWVYLGRRARSVYDDARASVTATVAGHHRLKSTSEGAAAGADIAEAVLDADDAPVGDDVPLGALRRRFGPREGDDVEVIHGKPDGSFPSLGTGEVVRAEDGEIVVERRIGSSGTYDALGIEREEGDTARTRFEEGARAYPTVYIDPDGDKKGTYVNVCTPLELFPEAVRYIDLYIDVVSINGETRVVDDEELSDAVSEGLVPESLAETARETAEGVRDGL